MTQTASTEFAAAFADPKDPTHADAVAQREQRLAAEGAVDKEFTTEFDRVADAAPKTKEQ